MSLPALLISGPLKAMLLGKPRVHFKVQGGNWLTEVLPASWVLATLLREKVSELVADNPLVTWRPGQPEHIAN